MTDICYVIGSGPSLKGFPFDQLPEGRRIGANKSAWLAGCDTLVTVDRNFHRQFAAEIQAFPGAKYAAVSGNYEALPGVTYWERSREDALSWTPGRLSGSNSGFAAFNLALLLGYRDIALLGMDFQWVEGQSHFHDGYASSRPHADKQLKGWVTAFAQTLPDLKERGIQVTNFIGLSGSRLQCFPTLPLAELI